MYMENLLSAKQIANKLGVHITWIYARTREDSIPHYRLGKYLRFSEKEISQWLIEQSSSDVNKIS